MKLSMIVLLCLVFSNQAPELSLDVIEVTIRNPDILSIYLKTNIGNSTVDVYDNEILIISNITEGIMSYQVDLLIDLHKIKVYIFNQDQKIEYSFQAYSEAWNTHCEVTDSVIYGEQYYIQDLPFENQNKVENSFKLLLITLYYGLLLFKLLSKKGYFDNMTKNLVNQAKEEIRRYNDV